MPRSVAVEIAAQDVAGVRVALAKGADRVELCAALGLGGLTPSAGLVAAAVEAAAAAGRADYVHVLVRPRGGGFLYDGDEVATTVRDIRFARDSGAAGVVVGALDERGRVDLPAVERFVAAADGISVTFHRALDIVADQRAAIETLIGAGVTRVLTSGGATRSLDGVPALRALAAGAGGRIQIMAGGGVRVEDVPALVAAGVDAVHLSARDTVHGAPSGPGGGSADYDITDPVMVGQAVAAVAAASR
ncbi:copper homeostasis protein CutC [Leifsonia sp. F6_8S_P_1B]|uniref:PF03932 family protein CutC n=1 Tax=Leifsonia williamsii TaxID=3035919 RepID=A0ABT8KBS7_9MICO|nr:copper homeostasis protein CutC [Leifsonia williamsii]MDN4614916.1 copper homeostasis protein CutC [Leifsonia williamsii]